MSPPGAVADETAPLQPLDPRVRTLWSAMAWVAAIPLGAAAGVVGLNVGSGVALAVATAFAAMTCLAAAVGPALRYRRWRYALREHELEIHRGVLWTTVTVIPYSRLQFVDTKQGPVDRMFELASLVVHTAAPGTSGPLPGLSTATADRLRRRLSDVREHDDTAV